MKLRNWVLGLVGFALMVSVSGCIVTATSGGSSYVTCGTSADCSSSTACLAASTSMTSSSTFFCTTNCSVGTDCPLDPRGSQGLCVVVSGFGGQCYQPCVTTSDCPANESCGMVGSSTFCVPGPTTTFCGGSGESCCATGLACNSGLTCVGNACVTANVGGAYSTCQTSSTCSTATNCVAASTSMSGVSTDFCTTGCVLSGDCPLDSHGLGGVCVTVSGFSNQCYQSCTTTNDCPLNETCGMVGGARFCVPGPGTAACGTSGAACCATNPACANGLACVGNVCTACGGVGQACCAGSACSVGSVCATDGTCGLAPYAGCSHSSLGAACLSGTSMVGGTVVATSCVQPMISNPGPDGFCSATCTSGTQCPRPLNAANTVNCYDLQAATESLCFIDCPNGQSDCPTGTVCVMTALGQPAGQQVPICTPRPQGM